MLHYIVFNTTCFFIVYSSIVSVTLITRNYNVPFHNLSKSIEFINWVKYFKYLFISSLFSFGQFSCLALFRIRNSLSLCSFGHSYIRCSTLWLPVPHGHSKESIILNLFRYSSVFPWAVTIAVRLGVSWILFLSLSLMFVRNCFVINPFVVCSHWICRFSIL